MTLSVTGIGHPTDQVARTAGGAKAPPSNADLAFTALDPHYQIVSSE